MQIRAILNPGTYHGTNQKPPFFEGWYFKLVSADEKHKIAIIPGVILGKDEHAFVQVIDGSDGKTEYFTFPFDQFQVAFPQFRLKIGENQFDASHLQVNISQPEAQLFGEIKFGSLNPWPVTPLSPGIMGWFSWVPKMECYHGVLSFDHSLQGTISFNGKEMDFTGGRGYIEKDWGKSFPAAWVWFQSNHFKNVSACITASVAIIPWVGNSFKGFIVGFWLDGELYRFTTYLNSKIESLEISDTHVTWVLRNRTHRLFLNAQRAEGGLLRGPTPVDMGARVMETLSASIGVRLETLQGAVLFEGTGENSGLEVVGDLQRLQADKPKGQKMPSIQAKITLKVLQLLDFGWSKGSLAEQRSRLEKLTRFLWITRGVTVSDLRADGVQAKLFDVPKAKPGIILYLHGGAYAVGSVNVHRNFLAWLAKACHMKVLAIDYRLAPEHPFPAALEDALCAYQWILSQGYEPAEIVIGGDSAGGGLAVAALISLRDGKLPLPACAVCISPWVNLVYTPKKSDNNGDPLLNPEILDVYSRYYAGETDTSNPLISPIFDDLQGLPPMLIQVGTNEILLEQIEEFCEKARQVNVEIALDCWQGMFHVFQMIPILPETKLSLKKIANFITEKTNLEA